MGAMSAGYWLMVACVLVASAGRGCADLTPPVSRKVEEKLNPPMSHEVEMEPPRYRHPTGGIHCISCHSERTPGCYSPIDSKLPVRLCDMSVRWCYTSFAGNGEVVRDCLTNNTAMGAISCATSNCNDLPIGKIIMPADNRLLWKKHVSAMRSFMSTNRHPLTCVSCESSPSINGVDLQHDDCFMMPVDRVQNMTELCHRNEVCQTVANELGQVMRGCTRQVSDLSLELCEGDECNTTTDLEPETGLRALRSRSVADRPLSSLPTILTLTLHIINARIL